MTLCRILPVLLFSTAAWGQAGALPSSESLSYNIEWRLITAGKATLQLQQERVGWQVHLHVESVGLVSKLFKVEDDYTSNSNDSWCAQTAQSVSHEGSRLRETKITFDSAIRKAFYQERDRAKNTVLLSQETAIPPCVHDVVGGIYFLRTLNLEPGQSVTEPVSDGKKSVSVRVEAQQREDVKTPAGAFHAVRYEIYLFNNTLYKRSGHLNVWLTDDRRKLPVQIRFRMAITVGTITLQLEKQ